MYHILGVPFQTFEFFMQAFKYQQESHKDKHIIYNKDGISEVVWNPDWEKIDCKEL